MKTILCAAVTATLLCSTVAARADGPSSAELLRLDPQSVRLEKAHQTHWRGQTLTIIGLIHAAVAVGCGVTMAVQSRGQSGGGDGGLGFGLVIGTAMFGATGAVFTTIGVPMWAVGAYKQHRIEMSASASGLRVSF